MPDFIPIQDPALDPIKDLASFKQYSSAHARRVINRTPAPQGAKEAGQNETQSRTVRGRARRDCFPDCEHRSRACCVRSCDIGVHRLCTATPSWSQGFAHHTLRCCIVCRRAATMDNTPRPTHPDLIKCRLHYNERLGAKGDPPSSSQSHGLHHLAGRCCSMHSSHSHRATCGRLFDRQKDVHRRGEQSTRSFCSPSCQHSRI